MNNRVLLSRQARNTTAVLKENRVVGDDMKKYEFPTEREQRTKRLAKTHYGHKSMQSAVDLRNNFMV